LLCCYGEEIINLQRACWLGTVHVTVLQASALKPLVLVRLALMLLPLCLLLLLLCPCITTHVQVVVYHRKAGMRRSYGSDDKFSAPLLMWMPLDQTYDPELHVVPSNAAKQQLAGSGSSKFADVGSPTNSSSKDVEYIVTEDAPIWQHVRRMLRPFLAVPALRQQPPAADKGAAAAAAGGEGGADAQQGMQQDDEQQQQTGLGSAAADVSMAAASGIPGSPVASPSPEPCCTSRLADAAIAAAPAAAGAGVSNAASEAGEGNSTWGSHGSGSPRSDVDMTGLDEAAAAVAAGIADDEAAAAAGSAGAVPDVSSPQQQQQQQSDGEEDASAATAALAKQQLGGGSSAGDAAAAGSSGLLGHGGVPVQPLDIWSAQPQVHCCGCMHGPGVFL
jgi:hypothetical protein